MASIGRTLFRFGGALLLGASATAIDDPGVLFAPSPDAPVVVALRDIPAGSAIDRGSIVLAHWPAVTVPSAAYRTIDSVAGRVSRVAIFKGEAIVPGRLAASGTGPGLEVGITPGKRAFAFRVTDISGIADLIQPNSRVDVLVVTDGGEKGRFAKLFMENMRVLAFGNVEGRGEGGRRINAAVATLEVTPDEAERIAIASTQGEIHLALRGYGGPGGLPPSSGDRMPLITPGAACDPPAGQTIVRDLLRRSCVTERQFTKDSAAAIGVPRR